MKVHKRIIFFLAVGIVVNWLCVILESKIFPTYLRDNIVIILITLLAINTATISVVVAKLHDISEKLNVDFSKTIREVKISLLEQILLIVITVILLILYNSPVIKCRFLYHETFFNTFFITVFIYAVDILRDTGMAVFDILKYKKKE